MRTLCALRTLWTRRPDGTLWSHDPRVALGTLRSCWSLNALDPLRTLWSGRHQHQIQLRRVLNVVGSQPVRMIPN